MFTSIIEIFISMKTKNTLPRNVNKQTLVSKMKLRIRCQLAVREKLITACEEILYLL